MPFVLVNKAKAKKPRKSRGELIAENHEGGMRRAFSENIADMLSDAKINQLADAISDDDIAAAMQIIPAQQDKRTNWAKMRQQFADNYRAIIAAAGKDMIAEGDLGFTFDIGQEDVVAWINDHAANLVANVSTDTKANIRNVIRSGALNGLTVEQQARMLKPMIGLTENQAIAVQNRLALHIKDGMDDEQASKMAGNYAKDLLNMRADMIARTESITAANQGKLASFNQARDEGLVGENPTKKWVGSEFESSDYGACEDCARLNDMEPIPIDEKFPGGDKFDDVDAPPLHPNCRCTVSFDTGF